MQVGRIDAKPACLFVEPCVRERIEVVAAAHVEHRLAAPTHALEIPQQIVHGGERHVGAVAQLGWTLRPGGSLNDLFRTQRLARRNWRMASI